MSSLNYTAPTAAENEMARRAMLGRADMAFWRCADSVENHGAKRGAGWARAFAKRMGWAETDERAREGLAMLPADIRERRDCYDRAFYITALACAAVEG